MNDIPTTSKDAVKALKDAGQESIEQFEKFKGEYISSVSDMSNAFVGSLKVAFDGLKGMGLDAFESLKRANQTIIASDALFSKFAQSYIMFREVTKTKDLFPALANSGQMFNTISGQIGSMGAEWDAVVKIIGKTPVIGGAMVGAFKNISENASLGQKAEAQMLSMLSTGGNLNQMFDDNGNIIGDLNTKMAKYINGLASVAEANGQTLSSTIKFSDAFRRIPGDFQENIDMGDALGHNMSDLSAAMKVLSGSGRSQAEFNQAQTVAYEDLGNAMGKVEDKSKKHLVLFASMSTLSKDLGLTFAESSGFLGDVAKQFKFVGDNTEAASRVLLKFTDALRNTGLTNKASVDIISGMVKSVGELTIGTKAFVSARSGGPGGLQGSVQIDKLNREEKSDEVMTMVLNTLKQSFGGRIVTQAEGAQSQEGAAQFTKQKMMIQSGAFGNLVGSGPGADEKATRLLEALASGNMSAAGKIGQQALEQVGKQGNNLQKENNTILNKVAISSERIAMATQLSALKELRKDFGTGDKDSIEGKELIKRIEAEMRKSEFDSSIKTDRNIKEDTGHEKFDAYKDKGFKSGYDGMTSSVPGLKRGFEKIGGKVGDSISNVGTIMSGINKERAEQEKIERLKANIPHLANPHNINQTTRDKLTRGAQQVQPQSAIRAGVRNANAQASNNTVTIKLTAEAAKLLEVESNKVTGNDQNSNETTADANVTGRQPGRGN